MIVKKKNLKNAPNVKDFKKQAINTTDVAFIVVGEDAWSYAGKEGKYILSHYGTLKDKFGVFLPEKPIVLGPTQIEQISSLRIIPENHERVRIMEAGEFSPIKKTALLLNLAQNSKANDVVFVDLLGEPLEDVSAYLEKLRTDSEELAFAEQLVGYEPDIETHKEPYVDEREEGKLSGLFYVVPKVDRDTGAVINEKLSWICSPLTLVGNGRNDSGDYYYLFKWKHFSQKESHIEAVSLADFGTEAGWRQLKRKGLLMTAKNLTNHLVEHFHVLSRQAPFWKVTASTGWQNSAYLLPSGEIIGEPSKPIYFNGESGSASGYRTKGTLNDWQREIAQNLKGNTSMMLGVAVALAAPLLAILGRDSFGVHLYAESSKGKTTILNIANSLYGDPDKIKLSWSATAVGVKNEAAARNDGLITLDEIGQAKDAKNLEAIAYDLFNETGKLQGKKEGGNKDINRWKVTAISTGEKDLETQLALQGVKVHAGQLVRLINIPLEEAKNLHYFTNNKSHADHLNESVKEYYGTAGREWIAFLAKNAELAKESYKIIRKKWADLADNMSGQVQRVATDRFAVLETALHLASHITQWSIEESQQVILKNFLNWKEEYGENSREETKLIANLMDWITMNEGAFVEYPTDQNAKTPNKVYGIKILEDEFRGEGGYFYVIPQAFKEATQGYPRNMALKILANAKILQSPTTPEKGYEYQFKVPKKMLGRQIRAYKITPILEETH